MRLRRQLEEEDAERRRQLHQVELERKRKALAEELLRKRDSAAGHIQQWYRRRKLVMAAKVKLR